MAILDRDIEILMVKGEKGDKGDPGSVDNVAWGDITGNIESQNDLVQYIATQNASNLTWGNITGNIESQNDLVQYIAAQLNTIVQGDAREY
jgi:hypothetical protein